MRVSAGVIAMGALLAGCHTMPPVRSARLAPEGAAIHATGVTVDMRGGFQGVYGEQNGTPYYNSFTGTTITPRSQGTIAVQPGATFSYYYGILLGLGPGWDLGVDALADIGLGLQLRRALLADPLQRGLALTLALEGRANLYSRQASLGLAATQRLGSSLDLTLGGRGGWLFVEQAYFYEGTDGRDFAGIHRGPYVEAYAGAEVLVGRVGADLGATMRLFQGGFEPQSNYYAQLPGWDAWHGPWWGFSLSFRYLPRPGLPDSLIRRARRYRAHSSAESLSPQARYGLAQRLLKAGLWMDAADELYQGLSLDPTSGLLHGALGLVFERGGEPELARFHVRRALAVDPANADWLSLGRRLGI